MALLGLEMSSASHDDAAAWLEARLGWEIEAESVTLQQTERRLEELRREENVLARAGQKQAQRLRLLQQELNRLRQGAVQ